VKNFACSLLIPALLAAGFAGRAFAQTPPDQRTAELLKKLEDLETNLAAIKAELAQRGLVGPSSVAPSAALTGGSAPQASSEALAAASAIAADTSPADYHTLGPLEFRGYSDFSFGRPSFETLPSGGLPGSPQSFSLGDFDLFVNSRLTGHLSMLGELLITSDFTNQFNAEMDRLMLTYTANKYLKISAGKFHTAIGYYSNGFYRARYFQTATGVPLLFTDEDDRGILPVHSIGLTATGELPSGPLGVHWVAEVANGTASQNPNSEAIQNFVEENNGKAVNFALYARPESVSGLDVGVSFYHDRLHPSGLGSFAERIYSAHAAVIRPHLELMAEGVLLQHDPGLISRSFNTFSGYAQASYKLRQIRPYFRYEYQNIPKSDPIFASLPGRLSGPSLGVRYDLSDFAALKVQYGLLGYRAASSINALQAQLAFAF
jgi:hypothetical protein